MLKGEYASKLTDKNRVALPAILRKEMNGQITLSRGYDGCLILVDEKRWIDLIGLIKVEPILNLSVRDTYRFILGGAVDIDLDKQGRFVMPKGLLDFAEISSDIVFLGINDWIEVWDKDKWQQKLDKLKTEASDIADKLMKL